MTDVAFDGGVSLVAGQIRSLLAAPLLVDGRVVALLLASHRAVGQMGRYSNPLGLRGPHHQRWRNGYGRRLG